MKSLVLAIALLVSFASAVFADNGGYALKFNGTDGYATATMNTGNTNSTMTMEFWFSPVATQAGTQFLADFHSISGTNNRRVMPYLNSGGIGIYCAPNTGDDNNAITQSTGITASPNVWYHVAVTINGSTLKMYVNGKLYVTTSLTDSYALTGTELLTLATDYWNTTYANIKMDEVRIWSSERTEAQIKANMYKELAGSEAGLLSYYRMSNGSGAALSDNQIAGTYGGVLSGGYTWVASGAFADNRNSLDFDGSNDYVDCGNSATVQRNGTQSFTVEAWVKPTGGVWVAAVSKFVHTASNEGYSLEIFSDNKVSLLYGNNWSDWNATTSTTALTPGVWSHIAATYDGSTVKIYINGNLSESAAWTDGVTDSGTSLLIGSRSGTTFFLGQMDEVRVWTVARTAAQLRESMAKTLVGNEAGLAAYYRLDELDGNTAYDLSSNANHGTLTSMDAATDRVASNAFTTWIGADSASWADTGNWSKGTVPASTSNVGLYKWGLGNEAAISGSPTVGNLLISSTAAPTLSSALTVNGNLVLEKNLDLNGQAVTLGATSFLVEGSGRAFGASGTIATTRALNNISALDVAGLGAKISTAANMGSTTITRGHAQQTGAGGNVSILRYYDITPTNNSSLNATLVFNYHDAELNALTEGNFKLYRSTDNGANWTNEEGVLSVADNFITKSAIPGFSRWTVGDATHQLSKTLPVITFDAAPAPIYLEGTFTVHASTTNTDSGALIYSYVGGPCAWVSGATFSSTGAGTCVVQADGAATSSFYAASNTQSIMIALATPTLTLSTLVDGARTNNATLNVSGGVSDVNGIQSVVISSQTTTAGATLSTTNNIDYTFSYPVTLATGSNVITTIATDNAGNSVADIRTIVLDTIAPNLTISSPADNSVTSNPTVTVSGTTDTSATVLVAINSGPTVTAAINATSFSLPISLATNTINTINVYAADLAGNTATAKRTVTNDQINPSLAVTVPNQDRATYQATITLSGTINALTNVSLLATCPTASVGIVSASTATWSVDISNLQPGVNSISIKATDQAGNSASVIRNIVYTATPVTINAVSSPTTTNSQTISGMREENATVVVLCPTAIVAVVTYPSATTWQTDLTLMSDGTNTVTVTATDMLGNASTPVTAVIVLNTGSLGAASGDITNDGVVDVRDALKALIIASGQETATAGDLTTGDVAPLVNGSPQPDGNINIGDVVVILRKAIGLVSW